MYDLDFLGSVIRPERDRVRTNDLNFQGTADAIVILIIAFLKRVVAQVTNELQKLRPLAAFARGGFHHFFIDVNRVGIYRLFRPDPFLEFIGRKPMCRIRVLNAPLHLGQIIGILTIAQLNQKSCQFPLLAERQGFSFFFDLLNSHAGKIVFAEQFVN